MDPKNAKHLAVPDLLKLLPILALAFYIAFIPHQGYPYPVHWSEWNHMAYLKSMTQAGSTTFTDPFTGEYTVDMSFNPYTGYHLLWSIFQQVTGISWLSLIRYLPGIIFMMTVLSVYVLARREGFGWEAAFLTCLIPTSLGIFGPGFMVPLALGLLFYPLALFAAFNFRSWPAYLVLFLFTCFLQLMHAPTAAGLAIIFIPYVLLSLKSKPGHSLGITLALALPIIAALSWTSEALLPTIQELLSPQQATPWIELPPLIQTYGYLPITLGVLGTVYLAARGGTKSYALVLGLLTMLLMLVVFIRFHYGLPILYERGLTYMLLLLSIIGGAGLYLVRSVRLPGRSSGSNLGNIACLTLVGLILAVSIPGRLATYYYHMVDGEDYRAFVWIKDNVGKEYDMALLDPWKGTAFTAVGEKHVRRRIELYRQPVDNRIYEFLKSGCINTNFLRDNEASLTYNLPGCTNPDLVEVRKGVYLAEPEWSRPGPGDLQSRGFEKLYYAPPAPWSPWSQNSTPAFLFPEPGRNGGVCAGIQMSESEPFNPWPWAAWLQDVPVESGTSYLAGGWVKTENMAGKGGAMIAPHWKGPGDKWIGATEFMSYVRSAGGWTYYEGVVRAPPEATTCTLTCLVAGCSGTAWFDDIVFDPLPDK